MRKLTSSGKFLWVIIFVITDFLVFTIPTLEAGSKGMGINSVSSIDGLPEHFSYKIDYKKFLPEEVYQVDQNAQKTFNKNPEAKVSYELLEIPDEQSIKSLQLAIKDLINTYGPGYPRGEEYLKEIDRQLKMYQNATDRKTRAESLLTIYKIRKEALLFNPVVCENPVLFVSRHQYVRDMDNTFTFSPIALNEYNGPGTFAPVPNAFKPESIILTKLLPIKVLVIPLPKYVLIIREVGLMIGICLQSLS